MTDPAAPAGFGSAVLADRTRMELPSQIDWIAPTLEFLRQRLALVGSCDDAQSQRLLMGLHEGLTNAVVHGNLEVSSALKEDGDAFARQLAERMADPAYNRRVVDVTADFDGDRWQWVVTDEGPGFDVAAVLGRVEADPENAFLPSGRGILMMRAFFDEVRWEAGGSQLVLTWCPAAERRRAPRRPVRRKVHVAPIRADGSVDWAAAEEAVTRDLSAGGARLVQQVLSRSAGQRVMLTVDVDGRSVHLPAEVRRCTPLDGGQVEVGCAFQVEAPPAAADAQRRVHDAVDGLLTQAGLADPAGDERRRHQRIAFHQRIELLADAERERVAGFSQDLSLSGVKFVTSREVPPGERTLVFPETGDPPLRIRTRIIRCTRITDRFYDVAATFLDADGTALTWRTEPAAG